MQIDPFASLLALASAGISIWALYVAKRAPLQARTRNHRDIVRNALTEVVLSLKPLETALTMGHVIPNVPNEIQAARRAIEEYGGRLPEYRSKLQLLDVQLHHVYGQWTFCIHDETRVTSAQEHVSRLEQEAHKADHNAAHFPQELTEIRAEVATAQRARDASLNGLREALKEAKGAANTYLKTWNLEDRNGS